MATLGQIISRMRAAGESEEDIAATRAEYEKINTPKPRPSLFDSQMAGLDLPRGNPEPVEPTDFWGGFGESLRSGEALETGLRGAKGFARGAIADLPSSVAGALRTGAGLMSFGNPQRQVEAGRELFEGLAALPGHVAEAYKFAPTRPEEFGRTAGQLMGQPAVGELAGIGALGAGRAIRRPAANLMSSVGRGLEGAKPVQGMPVTPKGAISSVVRASVAPAGRALQRGGEALRKQALAYEGAKAAQGAGIPLKAPPEGEPMGGGMGITRPRVYRQEPTIPAEPPPPSQVPFGTQPPIAQVESLTDYAARGGSGSNPVPPSAFGPDPILSEADPMFLSPEAPPAGSAPGGPRLSKEKVPSIESQFGGILEDVRGDLNTADLRGTELPVDLTEPSTSFPSRAEPLQNRPEGARLVKEKALTPEEEFARAVQEVRDQMAAEPGVELPPPPFSQGAGAPPEQPRFSVAAPKSPVVEPPPPLPEGTRLVKEKVPTIEEQFAAAVEEARREMNQEPGVELQPPPYSLGESAPPTQPRVTVTAPKASKELLIDKARADRLNRAAKRVKPEEPAAVPEGVDPTTGEIIEPPPPDEAFTRELPVEEPPPTRSAFGADEPGFWASEEGSKAVPEWAERVAEFLTSGRARPKSPLTPAVEPGQVSNRSMFDRSAQVAREEQAAGQSAFSDAIPGANEFSPDLVAQSENVLEGASPTFKSREVLDPPDLTSPVEQLSNEMLDRLSKLSPAEGGTGARANAAQIELKRRGIGEGVPHVNDPTFYNANTGDVIDYNFKDGTRSETRLEPGQRPSLLKDERGAIGLDIGPEGKGPVADKKWTVTDLNGKKLGNIEVTAKDINEVRTNPQYKHVSEQFKSDTALATFLHESNLEDILAENGLSMDDLPRVKVEEVAKSRLVKKPGEAPPKAEPKPKAAAPKKAEEPKEKEPESKVLPLSGKPGKSVLAPIATPASYEGMPPRYKLKDPSNHEAVQNLRRKGYHMTYDEDRNVVMVRGDLIESETMAKAPETAKAEPTPVKGQAERTGLDPDKAFAPGGDVEPIREALMQLRSVGAADARYRQLLPSDKQGPLGKNRYGEPETWRSRLTEMFTHPTKEEVAKKAQVEEFVKSVEATRERQPRPVEGKVEQVPLLRSKDVKFTPRPVKTVRNSPAAGNKNWISPRQEELLRQMRKKHGE